MMFDNQGNNFGRGKAMGIGEITDNRAGPITIHEVSTGTG